MDTEDFIWSDEYDGTMRKLYRKVCDCGKVFYVPKHRYETVKFCSEECAQKSRTSKVVLMCATCKTTFERWPSKVRSKSGLVFCSRKCKEVAQSLQSGIKEIQPSHYGSTGGINSYRHRALKQHGAVCSLCGYDEHKEMLDVDHIDSDRSNGSIENLRVLCVWCHALKTRGVPYHERIKGA